MKMKLPVRLSCGEGNFVVMPWSKIKLSVLSRRASAIATFSKQEHFIMARWRDLYLRANYEIAIVILFFTGAKTLYARNSININCSAYYRQREISFGGVIKIKQIISFPVIIYYAWPVASPIIISFSWRRWRLGQCSFCVAGNLCHSFCLIRREFQ